MTGSINRIIILSLYFVFNIYSQPIPEGKTGDFNSAGLLQEILDSPETDKDDYNFLNGRIIKSISIAPINVSGGEIDSVKTDNPDWFSNVVNSLHFKTRDWVVRNRLLFEEGDPVDSELISESERLLRTSGYFLDARIRISKDSFGKDSVDIMVVTKDKWTLIPLLSYNTRDKNGFIGLRDDNFLGLGHQLETTITHHQSKSVGWGGSVKYNAANIMGSYIDGLINYKKNGELDKKNIGLIRPFFSTEVEFAGGLNFSWENGIFRFMDSSNLELHPFESNSQDIWIAKSFPVWLGENIFKRKTKVTLSGRIARTKFSSVPFTSGNLNRLFENSTIYLIRTGIIYQRFYKDFYIDNFGTTEDVPIGASIMITAGNENGEFSKRWYSAAEAVYSRRFKAGYFSARLNLGGFRHNNNWEQNNFNFNFLYHSPLIVEGKWKYRLFIQNDYLLGFNRFEGEKIYLDINNGMRGFEKYSISGTKRYLLNFEFRAFSPFTPLGFVLGGIAFTDLGIIASAEKSLIMSPVYQSYGIGLRTMNESIANTNFEIALVYSPITPEVKSGSFKILFSTTIILGKRNLSPIKPEVTKFNND